MRATRPDWNKGAVGQQEAIVAVGFTRSGAVNARSQETGRLRPLETRLPGPAPPKPRPLASANRGPGC